MPKTKFILRYLAPSLIAVGIVIFDIFVSVRLHNHYYANNSGCGPKPSPLITLTLGIVALGLSVFGLIRAFRQHHRWLGSISIVLTLFILLGGLVALFALDFELCF